MDMSVHTLLCSRFPRTALRRRPNASLSLCSGFISDQISWFPARGPERCSCCSPRKHKLKNKKVRTFHGSRRRRWGICWQVAWQLLQEAHQSEAERESEYLSERWPTEVTEAWREVSVLEEVGWKQQQTVFIQQRNSYRSIVSICEDF